MPDDQNLPARNQDQSTASTEPRAIAERHWQQLISTACDAGQVATARVRRTEGVLQLALEQGAIDAGLLQQWGVQASHRLAAAIPNPLWPQSLIQLEDGDVHIAMLHTRAPVYRSTSD